MKRANNPRSFFGAEDKIHASNSYMRSRSRSHNKTGAGQDNSYILNNITSLLSPTNLRKIEQKNLYHKQIDSFYTPAGDNNMLNNSTVVINTIPDVQLRPQFHNNIQGSHKRGSTAVNSIRASSKVVEARKRSQSNPRDANHTASRYSRYCTNMTNA